MCIKIWFTELNTHLIGKYTLLYEIREILTTLYSETLKEQLFKKMENNSKYDNKSMNYQKSKEFNLSTSFSLFKSFNLSYDNQMSDLCPSFGSINVYDNEDKQYKILEKGLSIINDTFSNEYSVYYLNYSIIDTNNFYENLVYDFLKSIKYYIAEVFHVYIYEKNSSVQFIVNNIMEYFDNYFYKSFIIPNLKNKIYETIYLCIKDNILVFIKNKYFENNNFITNKEDINYNNQSMFSSAKTNWSSYLKYSFIFDLNYEEFNYNNINLNENVEIKPDEQKKEIMNYLIKNISYGIENASLYTQIEQKLDTINEQINIYNICTDINKWHNDHINVIKENDKKVVEEILKMKNELDIPFIYDQTKRYLLSYSLQYDWEFIRKVRTLEKYYIKNKDDIDMIEEKNLDDDLGNNYLGELDNIGQGNNQLGNNGFDLKSRFFEC